MTAATFRHPGQLAVVVASADAMSGGRVELGIATGWYEREHQYFGTPFPPRKERFDRLEEALAIITGAGPDIGHCVAWLCSDYARLITGCDFVVDGGARAKNFSYMPAPMSELLGPLPVVPLE